MPGVITIERNIHDEAIVISGALTVDTALDGLHAIVAAALEAAALAVKDSDGIVGHIKAALATTSTDMISVTDENAMVKRSLVKRVQITLTAIVFIIDQKEAEQIVRTALAEIRRKAKDKGDAAL